ncbi:Uma2 family endonuclease [Streptomyces sp. NPDC058694]|uniref:Uma2 family endonuclease n=1 Tax=Streptomyces sp. NPDC058694 TaxID=3346603 RepID=UPI0036578238
MAALAHERPENEPGLDAVVWQAWEAMELPEGYRAEIIEGAIEVSPTGGYSHSQIVFLLKEVLGDFLRDGDFAARNGTNVIHEGCVWVPDLFIVDHDDQGTVTVLTEPRPEKADWVGVHRVPYGTEVTIPEGPAKGFVVTEAITGPARAEK